MRELPAFELVFANADRRFGRLLRESDGSDCVDPRSPGNATAEEIACGGFRFTPPERFRARGVTMDELTRFIMLNVVERPVVNRTGLAGRYSLDIDYTRDVTVQGGTSIFTALQEQLGLKLEPTRVPMDVVVIDAIERPTPN